LGHLALVCTAWRITEWAQAVDRRFGEALGAGRFAEAGTALLKEVAPADRMRWLRGRLGHLVGRWLAGRGYPLPDVRIETLAEMDRDTRAILSQITVPLLLVCGDHDLAFAKDAVEETAVPSRSGARRLVAKDRVAGEAVNAGLPLQVRGPTASGRGGWVFGGEAHEEPDAAVGQLDEQRPGGADDRGNRQTQGGDLEQEYAMAQCRDGDDSGDGGRQAGHQHELPSGERPGEDQQRPHRDDEHRQGRRRASFRHVRAVIEQDGCLVPRIRADTGDDAHGDREPQYPTQEPWHVSAVIRTEGEREAGDTDRDSRDQRQLDRCERVGGMGERDDHREYQGSRRS